MYDPGMFFWRLGELLGKANVGCTGAVIFVLLIAGGSLGLVLLTWWVVLHSLR